jgi:CRISPR-associated endonuclease Cas2
MAKRKKNNYTQALQLTLFQKLKELTPEPDSPNNQPNQNNPNNRHNQQPARTFTQLDIFLHSPTESNEPAIEAEPLPYIPPIITSIHHTDINTDINPDTSTDTELNIDTDPELQDQTIQQLMAEINRIDTQTPPRNRAITILKNKHKTQTPPPLAIIQSLNQWTKNLPEAPEKSRNCLFVYDIPTPPYEKLLQKMPKYLKRMGFIRLQKSVYLATLELKVIKKLQQSLKLLIKQKPGIKVLILFVEERHLRELMLIGKSINIAQSLAREHTLFI